MADRSVDSCWSWLVCFCATFCQIVDMGIAATFGIFLPVIMKKYNSSRQTVAWIGSIAVCLTFFASPLAGRLSDRFGCRVIAIVGGLLCTASLVLTSFATKVTHYYFSYSFLFGIGACFVRVPCFLVTAKYFERRRALANGILTAGAGLGLFVFGPFTQLLLDNVSLSNTYRAMAVPCLLMIGATVPFYPLEESKQLSDESPPNSDAKKTSPCDACSIWKVPAFTVCALCFALEGFGFSIPGQHLIKHCQEVGLSADSAASLFMFQGLASFTTRIAAGYLVDVIRWLNPLHVFQVATCCIGVVTCLLGVSRSYGAFVVLSILFGLCDGALVSMANLMILTVVEPHQRAAAFGLANCVLSFALAAGPPVAGLMADQLGSYEQAFFMSGSFAITASCLPFVLCCLKDTPAPPQKAGQDHEPPLIVEDASNSNTEGIAQNVEVQ